MPTEGQEPNLGVLLFIAYRALEQRAHDAVAAAGTTDITPAQARVVARIDPGGTRVSELADRTRITKQSAAFLVEQLERNGYVERAPDPEDRRARLVRLTPKAVRLASVAAAEVDRALAEWADHVGTDRLRQMHETLIQLRQIADPWR